MKHASKVSVNLWAFIACLSAFAVPFFYWNKTGIMDWGYFNPLSLVVRSIVLHFHSLPIHNPYVCGGVDLLANPQSRIFSPLILFDVLLPPEWANLVSLFFHSFLGFWGMYRLLTYLEISPKSSFIGAFTFIHAHFFGLHFAEGHITFGPLLLLPWSLYLFLQWSKPLHFFLLAMLHVYFVHTGAIYAFIFSALLCASYGFLFPSIFLKGPPLTKRTIGIYFLVVFTAVFLSLVKALPILTLHSDRLPQLDFFEVPLHQAFAFLSDWTTNTLTEAPGLLYRGHEFGSHLSWVGLPFIFLMLFTKNYFQSSWKWLLLAFFWLVTSLGWGGSLNPWHLFHHIPLINHAHVQSRLLLLVVFFFTLLLVKALDSLQGNQKIWIVLSIFIIGESVFIRNYPIYFVYTNWDVPAPTTQLITGERLQRNVPAAWNMDHYFSGNVSKDCYEPAKPNGLPQLNDPKWEEIVYTSSTSNHVELRKYIPGELSFHYNSEQPFEANLNVNFLGGWELESPGKLLPTPNGLMKVELGPGSGLVNLYYKPRYRFHILYCFLIGCVGFTLLLKLHFWESNKSFAYNSIPPGYYDKVFKSGGRVRRHWHETKFRRVIDLFPNAENRSILDIGCASGTFLSLVPKSKFSTQVGTDVSPDQLEYANNNYRTDFRKFIPIAQVKGTFDVVTMVEVIEHLTPEEIEALFHQISQHLKPGGTLVITTPNYRSLWPLLETAVNIVSDVAYWDQHITHFNSFSIERKLIGLMGKHRGDFEVEFKTTSHFITPFIAAISPRLANWIASKVNAHHWKGHFGCLSLIVFKKLETKKKGSRKALTP